VTKAIHPDNVLGPDDLRLASQAFEAALFCLDEATTPIHPYTARHMLARYIIQHALRGQRDLHRLRDGALAYLSQSWGSTFTPVAS
jgi:hypothetical protein